MIPMEHMAIEWREINPDYIVSSDGQVGKRQKNGKLKMMKPRTGGQGYRVVSIFSGGIRVTRYIHRLVAFAFLPPQPTPKHEVNHRNGVRSDNRDTNLEWVTRSENLRHRFDILKHNNLRGEAQVHAKLTETQVREIRARCATEETHVKISADYGVGPRAVSYIAQGQTWAWLPEEGR